MNPSIYLDDIGTKNILLGAYAGKDLTTETHVFCFTADLLGDGVLTEYSTIMTEEEYQDVFKVVLRALQNSKVVEK